MRDFYFLGTSVGNDAEQRKVCVDGVGGCEEIGSKGRKVKINEIIRNYIYFHFHSFAPTFRRPTHMLGVLLITFSHFFSGLISGVIQAFSHVWVLTFVRNQKSSKPSVKLELFRGVGGKGFKAQTKRMTTLADGEEMENFSNQDTF